MNMAEAKQRLMEIANGEYHCIKYHITDNGKGTISQQCSVYLEKSGWNEGKTWEAAFFNLQEAMSETAPTFEGLPVTTKPD